MRKLSSDEVAFLQQWLFAVAVLVSTFFTAAGIRALLRRVRNTPYHALIQQLAPSLGRLAYVIGLKIFVEVAPLEAPARIWLEGAFFILAIVILFTVLRRVALTALEWTTSRADPSKDLQQGFLPLMRNVITLFAFLAGAIAILKHFNYDVFSLLTALGVGSLAVGLAAKETLSNMISGFTLIIDRNLRPGDRVSLGPGTSGDVEEIGLRSTRIRGADGNTLIVPNSELVNTKILNLSLPNRAMSCSSSLRVPYSVPFAALRRTILEALGQVQGVSRQRGCSVQLASLSEGYQSLTVSFWVDDHKHSADVTSAVNEKILQTLASQGVLLLDAAHHPTPLS